MNNITFPEMDSVTSSDSDNVLNTLDQNFNIFKVAQSQPAQSSQTQLPSAKTVTFNNNVQQKTLPSKSILVHPAQSQPAQSTQSQSAQSQPAQSQSAQSQPSQSQPSQPAQPSQSQPTQSQPTKTNTSVPTTTPVSAPVSAPVLTTEVAKIKTDGVSELIKFGKYVCPKKTLMLIALLVVLGVALFFATKPKSKKSKKDEDEEE